MIPMSHSESNSPKPVQKLQVPAVNFWGEQDGPPERELKRKLVLLFRRTQNVRIAYLARVTYGEDAVPNVGLCLRTLYGVDNILAQQIVNDFASIFGRHEHLDVISVNSDQESVLAKVCRPFWDASASLRSEQ